MRVGGAGAHPPHPKGRAKHRPGFTAADGLQSLECTRCVELGAAFRHPRHSVSVRRSAWRSAIWPANIPEGPAASAKIRTHRSAAAPGLTSRATTSNASVKRASPRQYCRRLPSNARWHGPIDHAASHHRPSLEDRRESKNTHAPSPGAQAAGRAASALSPPQASAAIKQRTGRSRLPPPKTL